MQFDVFDHAVSGTMYDDTVGRWVCQVAVLRMSFFSIVSDMNIVSDILCSLSVHNIAKISSSASPFCPIDQFGGR